MARYVIFVVVAAILAAPSAFAQAAAETVLTHSISTSMGSAIGNSLGQTTNRLAGKMGQQTSHVVTTPIKPGLQKSAGRQGAGYVAAAPAQTNQSGSMILSIEGGEPRPAVCKASDAKSSPKQAESKPMSCSPSTPDRNAYRSFVTLPPAK